MRILTPLALAAAFGLAAAGAALAHAHLTTAVPAPQSVVAATPAELDLTFSEALNLKFSGVKLTGPDGKAVATGATSLAGDGARLVVPLPGKLAPGSYTVIWHALSKDGHKTQGTYSFTVKP